ncbi:MAG: imidazole glycerol phosphate synthase subunit HisH [Bacteroidales bacterium]|jgi:glutamine amidotransferase
MIAIIDYGMGNLWSVKRKMDRIEADSVITSDEKEIRSCEKIILPGVGHFATAVSEIKKRGLWDLLYEQVIKEGKYILGICLGMQLMAHHSEEGDSEGFGWIDAEVIRFKIEDLRLKIGDSRLKIADGRLKIPHVGWNTLEKVKDSPLFMNIDMRSEFYFVHSYHIRCNNPENILAETVYGYPFVSAVNKDNIFGVQFHPEKSHDAGEMLLKNFVNL